MTAVERTASSSTISDTDCHLDIQPDFCISELVLNGNPFLPVRLFTGPSGNNSGANKHLMSQLNFLPKRGYLQRRGDQNSVPGGNPTSLGPCPKATDVHAGGQPTCLSELSPGSFRYGSLEAFSSFSALTADSCLCSQELVPIINTFGVIYKSFTFNKNNVQVTCTFSFNLQRVGPSQG